MRPDTEQVRSPGFAILAKVQQLAHDATALATAEKLARLGAWSGIGRSERAIWGACEGSGGYIVQADLTGPDLATRCPCPSRRFPCKHGLALLLVAARAWDEIPEASEPSWVSDWQAQRDATRAKKLARLGQANERAERAERIALGNASEADEAAHAQAQAEQEKRAAARDKKVRAGLERLGIWLEDLVRQGLGRLETATSELWETEARRLVDAQLPGLAGRVRALGEIARYDSPVWLETTFFELGKLALACEAERHMARLMPAARADLRQLLGFTLTEDEVVAHGDLVRDSWLVLAFLRDEEGVNPRLVVERTWLRGRDSGRFALLMAFQVGRLGGRGPATAPAPEQPRREVGTSFDGTLAYWPSATPTRARIVHLDEAIETAPAQVIETAPAQATAADSIGDLLTYAAEAFGRNPWLMRMPVWLEGVRIAQRGQGGLTVSVDPDAGAVCLSLDGVTRESAAWLLAISGGHPTDLMGEWNGAVVVPLAVRASGRWQQLPARGVPPGFARWASPGRATELGSATQAAIIGTANHPEIPPTGSALDPILRRADAHLSPERQLLVRGAALGLARAAGTRPQVRSEPVLESPPERAPEMPRALAELLAQTWVTKSEATTREFTLALAEYGLRLPFTFVSDALEHTPEAARATLGPLIGERGRWLAAELGRWPWLQSEDSSTDPEDTQRIWDEGLPAAREALLRQLRRSDPAAARQLLGTTWKSEKGDQRERFLDILIEHGASSDDLAFVETALTDRAGGVRRAAARGLLLIPESGSTLRVRARFTAAIQFTSATVLQVTLPTSDDPSWPGDGLSTTTDLTAGLGPRESLLTVLIAASPLTAWDPHPPEHVTAALRANDHGGAIARGVIHQVLALPQPEARDPWIRALVGLGLHPKLESLLTRHATPTLRDHLLTLRLARTNLTSDDLTPFAAQPAPWSVSLSTAYLDALERYPSHAIHGHQCIGLASRHLHPALFDRYARYRGSDITDPNAPAGSRFAAFANEFALRRRFYQELSHARPPA